MTTKIQWADETWNPITGCTPVSVGCLRCYAKRMAVRLAGRCGYPHENPFMPTVHQDKLEQPAPLKWRAPRRVFICSMGDLFHSDVGDGAIYDALSICDQAPQHVYIVLTKRPGRMAKILDGRATGRGLPRNLWIGVSAENQAAADERIPALLSIPGARRFVSVEPMLSPVDLSAYFGGPYVTLPGDVVCDSYNAGVHGVIVGEETGPGFRPLSIEWVAALRDQCGISGVPCYYKHGPTTKAVRTGGDLPWAARGEVTT